MDKVDKVIDKALEPYKPLAAEGVKEDLCPTCPDKRCERTGKHCHTYDLVVKIVAWNMTSKNN